MAWELSSTGFIMTLSGFVPDLIEEDFRGLVERALEKQTDPLMILRTGASIPVAKKSWNQSIKAWT